MLNTQSKKISSGFSSGSGFSAANPSCSVGSVGSMGSSAASVGSVGSGSSASSFESLLLRIREQLGYEFPNAAVVELPLIISKETQEALIRLEQESGLEAAEKAILTAIDKINRGALETVDKLIRDNLYSTRLTEPNRIDAGA